MLALYSRLATSLRSLAIILPYLPLYYSTILTSTCATVSTDIPSYEAIHRRMPLQLTLISPMGQRACHLPFHIESRPITSLWIDVTMQPFDCRKDQTKIVDAPLRLTLKGQSFWLNVIPSLLTANILFLDRIVCIQQHRGLSVSEPPL